ncbi:hypothetical protein QL093DRAFT_2362299 [Fusarium oxysporum]|nr:hypothetical protein QL093DRAFT_2362299 [Fusarium oxysporum]
MLRTFLSLVIMDPLPIQEQSTYPILSPAKVQKLETLGLYYNSPEQAIICIKCGFALSPRLRVRIGLVLTIYAISAYIIIPAPNSSEKGL